MKAQRALLRGNPQHLLLVSINGEKREMLLQNGLTMFGYLAEATGPASARETIFRSSDSISPFHVFTGRRGTAEPLLITEPECDPQRGARS